MILGTLLLKYNNEKKNICYLILNYFIIFELYNKWKKYYKSVHFEI